MHPLDRYLAQYFLDSEHLAQRCGIKREELARLVEIAVIPAASYTVTDASLVTSFAMGQMEAPGATTGEYFHPSTTLWVRKALRFMKLYGWQDAHGRLRADFHRNLHAALAAINATRWRLTDCFTGDGSPIAEALRSRLDKFWLHFLRGTFGLCVAMPDSEAAIAHKETTQERLVALTENGTKADYTPAEAAQVLQLAEVYERATMPFSPVDYPISSR